MIQVNVPLFGIGVDQVTNEKGQRMPVLTIQHMVAIDNQAVPLAQYTYLLEDDIAKQLSDALAAPSVVVPSGLEVR